MVVRARVMIASACERVAMFCAVGSSGDGIDIVLGFDKIARAGAPVREYRQRHRDRCPPRTVRSKMMCYICYRRYARSFLPPSHSRLYRRPTTAPIS